MPYHPNTTYSLIYIYLMVLCVVPVPKKKVYFVSAPAPAQLCASKKGKSCRE